MDIHNSVLYKNALESISCDGLQGKVILVTGATGMIGSCLVDAVMHWNETQSAPCSIIATGRSIERALARFSYYWESDFFSFVKEDFSKGISNLSQPVDYIIHAASHADPVSFSLAPVDTLLTNVLGTNHLLDYGRTHGMKRFLFVSSGEVYGQPNAALDAFTEDYCGPVDHFSARACYPAGKRAAEVLCQSYITQYHMDAVIVRPCHIFGPTMTSADSRAVSEFFRNAVCKEDIVLKSAGLIERSHCYVIDAVNAILFVLRQGICGQAYNIAASDCQMTIREFAQTVAQAGGRQVTFENPNDLELRGYTKVARAVLSSEHLQSIGWKPLYSSIAAVEETIQVLRECNKN